MLEHVRDLAMDEQARLRENVLEMQRLLDKMLTEDGPMHRVLERMNLLETYRHRYSAWVFVHGMLLQVADKPAPFQIMRLRSRIEQVDRSHNGDLRAKAALTQALYRALDAALKDPKERRTS